MSLPFCQRPRRTPSKSTSILGSLSEECKGEPPLVRPGASSTFSFWLIAQRHDITLLPTKASSCCRAASRSCHTLEYMAAATYGPSSSQMSSASFAFVGERASGCPSPVGHPSGGVPIAAQPKTMWQGRAKRDELYLFCPPAPSCLEGGPLVIPCWPRNFRVTPKFDHSKSSRISAKEGCQQNVASTGSNCHQQFYLTQHRSVQRWREGRIPARWAAPGSLAHPWPWPASRHSHAAPSPAHSSRHSPGELHPGTHDSPTEAKIQSKVHAIISMAHSCWSAKTIE